jgi:hypothetical protein
MFAGVLVDEASQATELVCIHICTCKVLNSLQVLTAADHCSGTHTAVHCSVQS